MADAVHDKFVERLIGRIGTITIGDPLDPATDFGPVISAEAQDRILRYIDSGPAEGATLAYGGGRPAGPRFEQSGLGRELGPHAFDEYTEEKFVHLDLSGRLDRRAYALPLSTPPT